MHRIILFGCLLVTVAATAQKKKEPKELFFLYDSKWKTVSQAEDASYLTCVKLINDTTYEWSNYHMTGPLLSVETYRDKEATIPNGYWAYFDDKGRVDSNGHCVNGKRENNWHFFSDEVKVTEVRTYSEGRLTGYIDEETYKANSLRDSLEFVNAGGIPAEFNGGDKAWAKYLIKNIKYPDRAVNLRMTGMAKIAFKVLPDGTITDTYIFKSVEYSIDREALRLILGSPRWKPSSLKGRNTNAYRIQPITFAG